MRLTKFGHACVQITEDDRTIVIDPGSFSEASGALAAADAVLITHEHFDHFDPDALRAAMAERPALE
ncbi:MBL fold metallo-hydrolase, partial [Micromonospora aurantiaca]|nr:MBL fold metallo-hydrolase [Micromonospora aurantiaca]